MRILSMIVSLYESLIKGLDTFQKTFSTPCSMVSTSIFLSLEYCSMTIFLENSGASKNLRPERVKSADMAKDSLRNNRLNFVQQGHSQPPYDCKASSKKHFEHHFLDRKIYGSKCAEFPKVFDFPQNQYFCSPKLPAANDPSRYYMTFLYYKNVV